ncbi:MAG: DUF3261 domain-containing protein [Desulfuromonadales bacterium]|nr:DUF3261 domain-containing protein [Desulfuromonadales bacterium]
MTRFLIMVIGALLAAGCAHGPFGETPTVSLESVEPARLLEDFKSHVPEQFQLLNTVVFERSGMSFTAIGYLDINRVENRFRVVCLNPLGVQLFELSGDRSSITTHSVLPPLMQYGDLPTVVGTDIRNIFLGLVPADDAQVWRSRNSISFWQPSATGRMQYLFAGASHDLVEKNYYENSEIVWSVSYHDYAEINGKRYPRGIVLVNHRHGYTLTVRHKELYS